MAEVKIREEHFFMDPCGIVFSPDLQQDSQKVDVRDFQVEKLIGRSLYGKVALVRHRDEGTVYALKTLSKKNLMKAMRVDQVKTERR